MCITRENEMAMFFVVCRSGSNEQYGQKEQLLTGALSLYEESSRKKKENAEKAAEKKSAGDQQRELAVQIRDAAMSTLSQKRPRGKSLVMRKFPGDKNFPSALYLYLTVCVYAGEFAAISLNRAACDFLYCRCR